MQKENKDSDVDNPNIWPTCPKYILKQCHKSVEKLQSDLEVGNTKLLYPDLDKLGRTIPILKNPSHQPFLTHS